MAAVVLATEDEELISRVPDVHILEAQYCYEFFDEGVGKD